MKVKTDELELSTVFVATCGCKWHSLSGRPRYGGDLAAKAAKESRKWKAKAKLYTI